VRRQPGARRSGDPIFSVAALGPQAERLTADLPQECFGAGSFWERLLQADGLVCNLNVWVISTLIHHVEWRLGVPYRFEKLFPGLFVSGGRRRKGAAIFFCRDLGNPDTLVATEPFDRLALERGLARRAGVGRGYVTGISARDTFRLIEKTLPERPWFLIRAEERGSAPVLERPHRRFETPLPPQASMAEMIEALWRLPRDIVSDGYDAALQALAGQLPMTIHAYPTGMRAWSWIVPEKWSCQEARLESLDGRCLFSTAESPLHVVSYSLPFEGEVSRAELLEHLHVHPTLPEETPFIFKYYERDWGLCCSQRQREALQEERYRVVIRSGFHYGTLKVGEAVLPGESAETVVLCAHLCHPGQVNDDLTGVVAGLQVMRELARRPHRRYTYRLLILPETIGSVAWLSRHEALIPTMKGGLFLEWLGRDNPPTLQHSFGAETEIDHCFELAFRARHPDGRVVPYRGANDERQFNAPGVRVPMLALYRNLPREHPDWPYREYHSSADTPALVPAGALEEMVALTLHMLDTLERNYTPVNLFRGEVFMSRFGLHVSWYDNPEAYAELSNIIYRIDGTASLAEIARELGISFEAVWEVAERLRACGLVSRDAPGARPL
jgi:aminopeptidase-like protein